MSLFELDEEGHGQPRRVVRKLPYKFSYRFLSEGDTKPRTLMIEDWEIGALYWNCLKYSNGDEEKALQKVKDKYETEFIHRKDLNLFLGTTKEWHYRRARNPFVIIGLFYPKIETQLSLTLE